jgi:hypothetical protein
MGMVSRTRTFVGTNVARDRDDRVSAALRQDCAGCGQDVNAFLGGDPANSEYEGAVEGVEPSPPGTHGFRVLGHDCRPTRELVEVHPVAHRGHSPCEPAIDVDERLAHIVAHRSNRIGFQEALHELGTIVDPHGMQQRDEGRLASEQASGPQVDELVADLDRVGTRSPQSRNTMQEMIGV